MSSPSRRDEKLFSGFGIFPFSLMMLLVMIPSFIALNTEMLCKCSIIEPPLFRTAKELPNSLLDDAIYVSVQRDGAIFFQTTKVTPNDLIAGLRSSVEHGSERRVYMRIDPRSQYSVVKNTLQLIGAAGIRDVSFLSRDEQHW